jgi:hypothetical protein
MQMLASLASLDLTGVLQQHNAVRIHHNADVLENMRTCGLGAKASRKRRKGSSSQEVAEPKFIDVTLEEAYFMQVSLKCLKVCFRVSEA